MIIVLRPPEAVGPLRIGATGQDTVDTLRQFGTPLVLCGARDSRPIWGVHRPSGLFVGVYFDARDRVGAVEIGRGHDTAADTVTYDGLSVFSTPAADLVARLRRDTTVRDEEGGHVVTAPGLLLEFWRSTTDGDGRFFDGVLLARPGYGPDRALAWPDDRGNVDTR